MKASYATHSKLIAYFALAISSTCALALTVIGTDPLFLTGMYLVNTVSAVLLIVTELEERRFQR